MGSDTQFFMGHSRKILWRGRIRWTPDGVIAWTHDGERISLGRHSLDKTRKIADELGYSFVVTVAPGGSAEHTGHSPAPNGGNPLRNVSQGGGSFLGSAVGTAQPKKQIDSVLPLNHSHCHLSRNEVIHT